MPQCNNCKVSFPNYVVVNGIKKNVCKRKYCLLCSPFGQHNTRKVEIKKNIICVLCEQDTKKGNKICPACQVKINRRRLKLAAIEYKGGKCIKCGWNGHPTAFDFHHQDPDKKDFSIGESLTRTISWDKIKEELDKCDLLCAICHRIEHTPRSDKFFELVYNYKGKMKLAAIR